MFKFGISHWWVTENMEYFTNEAKKLPRNFIPGNYDSRVILSAVPMYLKRPELYNKCFAIKNCFNRVSAYDIYMNRWKETTIYTNIRLLNCFCFILQQSKYIMEPSPVLLMKAVKNDVEVEAMNQAFVSWFIMIYQHQRAS